MKNVFFKSYFKFVILLIIIFLQTSIVFSQYVEEGVVLNNNIYSNDIATVQFNKFDHPLSTPVVSLNGGNLELSFDDLVEDYYVYKYTFFQCNADWTKNEDLEELDYLDGYSEGEIENYSFSLNTLQSYVHYNLKLPSKDMKWKISGNYILKIYPDDEPNNPVMTLRFQVVESSPVRVVDARVARDSNPVDYLKNQQIEFNIKPNDYPMPYPSRDLKVIIQQNYRWDNAKTLKPFSVSGNQISYNYYDGQNVFHGNNEYYYFDIKNLNFNSEYINSIRENQQGYQVYLQSNKRIVNGSYITRKELCGQFAISAADIVDSPNIEAEYTSVHFFLEYDAPVVEGDIYLLGELTMNRFDEFSKMEYNYGLHGYEKTLYLKQGYYNYLYAFVPDNSGVGDVSRVCGNFWETNNQYQISVYYRQPGDLYDHLISYKIIDSHPVE